MRPSPVLLFGIFLILCDSVYAAPACSSVAETQLPSGEGYLRTIYDVDFEEPEHTTGTWPTEGIDVEKVGLYQAYMPDVIDDSHQGLPEVVTQPLLDSQSAELNARPVNDGKLNYDNLYFQLRRAADFYIVDLDMVVEDHINLSRTLVTLFDTESSNGCSVVFDADGDIYLGGNLASYSFNTRYHISMMAVPNGDGIGDVWLRITQGESLVYAGQFRLVMSDGVDFGALRIRNQGSDEPDNNYAQVDNIRVRAGYRDIPALLDPSQDGVHALDFNDADFYVAGVYRLEKGFVSLFGQPTTDVSADGTQALRFSSSDRPVIMHQLGLPFAIKKIDVGEYATLLNKPREATFTGHRYDGTTVSVTFTTDGIADGLGGVDDFETFEFGDDWSYLKAITLNNGFAIDNVELVVDTDLDGDGVHDWKDLCLPEPANDKALSRGESDNAGCPLQNRDAAGNIPASMLLLIGLSGLVRYCRNRRVDRFPLPLFFWLLKRRLKS